MENTSVSGDVARVTVLEGTNSFTMWNNHINILFEAKDLKAIVDGDITINEVPPDQVNLWKERDAVAKLYIIQSTASHVQKHLLSCNTSAAMLQKLKFLYEKDSAHQKNLLMEQLYAYKWDKNIPAIDNAGNVVNVAYQLSNLGQEMNDVAIMSKIVSMLPPALDHFSTAWDSVPAAEKTVDNLIHRLQREEDKLKTLQQEQPSAAFRAEHHRPSRRSNRSHPYHMPVRMRISCYTCGQQGHSQRECRNCSICKKDNHSTQNCYFRSRFCGICKTNSHYQKDCRYRNDRNAPTRHRQNDRRQDRSYNQRPHSSRHEPKQSSSGSSKTKVSFMARADNKTLQSKIVKIQDNHGNNVSKNSELKLDCPKNTKLKLSSELKPCDDKITEKSLKPIETKNSDIKTYVCSSKNKNTCCFVVDSGATGHMTNESSALSNITEQIIKINLAQNGTYMQSPYQGTMESDTCELKKVLFVPELTANLLSASEVANSGGSVLLDQDGVKLLKTKIDVPEHLIILKGPKTENGLFTVDIPLCKNKALLSLTKNESLSTWHRRMGHLSIRNLKKLPQLCKGVNMHSVSSNHDLICSVCAKAKQTKNPHNTTRQRANRLLKIIHTDVGGPVDPPTYDGKSYFVVFMDDYSHYCEVYLMERKSEVYDHLTAFIKSSENQHELKAWKIRCDNGGEYVSSKLKAWCKNEGKVLDYSIPRNPEQDGTSERMIRTLLEKTRALIFDSDLKSDMWGEATLTAAYLSNRSPSTTVNRLPAEIWTNKRQDLSNIQIFGTIVYARITTYLKKLEVRSNVNAVFVGYAPHGYRLWDPKTKKIFLSRDVIFTNQLYILNLHHPTSMI